MNSASSETQPWDLREPEHNRLRALLEGALFAAPQPVRVADLARALGYHPAVIQHLLEEMRQELEHPRHALQVRFVAGGYRLSTKPEHHEALREAVANLAPPLPFSKAALETLSIIALHQPVSAAEIQEMRGVRNSDPIRTLLRRKLIAPAGRAPTRGHPLRYRTTPKFLVEFGLESLEEVRAASELRHEPKIVLE
jgi:segregation and condensation protein B